MQLAEFKSVSPASTRATASDDARKKHQSLVSEQVTHKFRATIHDPSQVVVLLPS
jgi:hypothetical protein